MSAPRFGQAGLLGSFRHAWEGLVETVLHQRNMRIHLVSGVLVGLVGSGLPLGLAEKVTLIFCVVLIFFAEILNSALEQLVDLAVKEYDVRARRAKDAAAAGVLVLAIGTVAIFAALLVHNREDILTRGEEIARQVVLGVPLAVIVGLLITPFRRAGWLDALLFLSGLLLLAALTLHTTSAVFTALTLGLHLLAFACARARRSEKAAE